MRCLARRTISRERATVLFEFIMVIRALCTAFFAEAIALPAWARAAGMASCSRCGWPSGLDFFTPFLPLIVRPPGQEKMKGPFWGASWGSGKQLLFPLFPLEWIRTERYVREFEQAGCGGRRELRMFPDAIAAWAFEGAIRIDPYPGGAHTSLHRQYFLVLLSSALHAASASAC